MERYLKKLRKLISKHGKPTIAAELGVSSTNTINSWLNRKMIPAKYLDKIDNLK